MKTIKIFKNGLKKKLLIMLFLPANKGSNNKVRIAKKRPITPNNLFGIDLRIA
jgi:hypothetical protein